MNAQMDMPDLGRIIPNVPAAEYHKRELGVISAGVLRMLNEQTPAHYRAWVADTDENDTPDKMFGRAYHDRVLLPKLFAETYVAPPKDPPRDLRHLRNAKKPSDDTIASIAWWDGWQAENAGRVVLSAKDFDLIEAMHYALMRDSEIAEIFSEGDSEITLRCTDDETGLECKARADRWNRRKRWMGDLKTTVDASERGFARSVVRYGYDITHAHYSECARLCGEPLDKYVIVAQEKRKPYLAALYQLDEAAETRGYEIRQKGMETMAACLASGDWPGYPRGIQPLALPGWAIANEMEISYVE